MEGVIPPRSPDTSADAERVQVELLRAARVVRRLHLALSLSADVISAARRALGRARPQASQRDLDVQFVELHYSRELAEGLRTELMRRDRASERET